MPDKLVALDIDQHSVGSPITLRLDLGSTGKTTPSPEHLFAASLGDRFVRSRPCAGRTPYCCRYGVELFPRTPNIDEPAARAEFASELLARLEGEGAQVFGAAAFVDYVEVPLRLASPFGDYATRLESVDAWGTAKDPDAATVLAYLGAVQAVRGALVAQLLSSRSVAGSIGDGELFALVESLSPAARLLVGILLEHSPVYPVTLSPDSELGDLLCGELPLLTHLELANPVPDGTGFILRRGKRLRPKEPRRGLCRID